MSEAPLVSIVLPTRNGADTLPAVLAAIRRQSVDYPFETVAIDSGSTDGTLALLEGHVDKLISIQSKDFDHGLTRNLAIRETRGEFIVLIVQDALPATDTWLRSLVAPLLTDRTLAGAFARQVPRPDASALTRHYLQRWVAASDVARVVALSGSAQLDAMTPDQRLWHCAFDDVCSCIRRSVWLEHPFRSTPIAEDLEWAREVLLSGYRLAFVSDSVVVHSHDRSLAYEFQRTRELHGRLVELFGLQTIGTLPQLARAIIVTAGVNLRCEKLRPSRIPRALGLAVVSPLAQYLGARAQNAQRRIGGEKALS